MNLILQLTPETESRLKLWTALTGKNPETVALEAIDEKLADENGPLSQTASLAGFEKWFAAHPSSESLSLDDSRAHILL